MITEDEATKFLELIELDVERGYAWAAFQSGDPRAAEAVDAIERQRAELLQERTTHATIES